MPRLYDMKQARAEISTRIEGIVMQAGKDNRALTERDQKDLVSLRADASDLDREIRSIEDSPNNSLLKTLRNNPAAILGGAGEATTSDASALRLATPRTPEYARALHTLLSTGGKVHSEELTIGADGQGGYAIPGSEAFTRQRLANGSFPKMHAATYEGSQGASDAAGGYAISVPTDQLIVPLALPDLGIFDASTVIPTNTDLKVPSQTSFGTSEIKSESTTGTVVSFGGDDPALGQTTLVSWMVGALRLVSWELLQDVEQFRNFVVDDLIKGQRITEGALLASGNGTSQPQAVFGNTGDGTGDSYTLTGAAGDATVLLNSLFDVVSTLKAAYQPGACWVMSRSTCLAIRRAQMQANLFAPVVETDPDGTTRILGRPVFFDTNAPSLPSTTTSVSHTSVLYGDFKAGYLIGVRGGAGINIKILDQPWASSGQMGILAYRRLDGRIRRSEAIQGVSFTHS